MFHRYSATVGRLLFPALVLSSIYVLSAAQTAPPREGKDETVNLSAHGVHIEKVLPGLAKLMKLDVVIDDAVKVPTFNLELKQASARKAFETILKNAQLTVKMKDDHTLLVFADTPENREKYAGLTPWK
ncbi:MAG TPA: hypothetical protein VJ302_09635 [Blastocatellia bacterium]|nr:hypothetical protein [Blastocatellia bacterium]